MTLMASLILLQALSYSISLMVSPSTRRTTAFFHWGRRPSIPRVRFNLPFMLIVFTDSTRTWNRPSIAFLISILFAFGLTLKTYWFDSIRIAVDFSVIKGKSRMSFVAFMFFLTLPWLLLLWRAW